MRCETSSVRLRDLVIEFQTGAILLPQFQRDYVWKPTKIRNLLDSLLREFPIGSFYLWRPIAGTKIDAKKRVNRVSKRFEGYLIDGQQRLTSLEAAFGLYSGEDKGKIELRCYLDLAASDQERGRDTRMFVSYAGSKSVARRIDRIDPALVPLDKIFSANNDLREEIAESLQSISWGHQRINAALDRFDRACRMLDQQVPRTVISDISDKDAVEVFGRLNKGGTALKQGDVRAAELARGRTVIVLTKMRDFVSGELPQRLGFGFSFAFRALVVFHIGRAQFHTLKEDWIETRGPHGRSLAESWKAAERALGRALLFVDQKMGWSRRSLLPSANAVIVLAYAMSEADRKMKAQRLYYRWLCLTALRGIFQGSVETTINRFLRRIDGSRGSPARALMDALTRNERRRIDKTEFCGPAPLWGPPTQVIHAWLSSSNAQDWVTGEPLKDLARRSPRRGPTGELSVHHIFFPRERLRDPEGGKSDRANRAANYALLSVSTNAGFGDQTPEEVLRTLGPEKRRRAAVQLFSDDAGDRIEIDKYEEFCVWRSEQIANAINKWLGIGK